MPKKVSRNPDDSVKAPKRGFQMPQVPWRSPTDAKKKCHVTRTTPSRSQKEVFRCLRSHGEVPQKPKQVSRNPDDSVKVPKRGFQMPQVPWRSPTEAKTSVT